MTEGNGRYREILEQKIRQGLLDNGYVLGDKLSVSLPGPSGSKVFRGEKDGEAVALKIASYSFLDSFEDDAVEKLDDFRRRERETLQQAGNHPNIPSYRDSFTIDGDERSEPIHVLVMEYLNHPSIADRIKKRERLSDGGAKILLRGGLSAENHLHIGLPTQILHRDVKTSNVLTSEDNAYLIDFDIVKQGDSDSTRATQLRPNGYYPEDFYRGTEDSQRPEHDVVALGNVAIAGIAGKEIEFLRYEQGVYGLEPIDTSRLNVYPEIRKYLAKITAPLGSRFHTAQEALEGLERVLGSSLPARIEPAQEPETREVAEIREGDLLGRYSIEETDTHIIITEMRDGKFLSSNKFEKGRDIYETAKRIREDLLGRWGGFPEHRGYLAEEHVDSVNREVDGVTLSFLQYAAQKNPILQPVVDGDQTMQEVYDEVKKGKPSVGRLVAEIAESFGGALTRFHDGPNPFEITSEYKQSREEHNPRVGKLEKVVSGAEQALGGLKENLEGAMLGGGLSFVSVVYLGSYFLPEASGLTQFLCYLSGTPLGVKLGSNIQRGFKRRFLKKKYNELQRMVTEGRAAAGLEDKVGDVSLDNRENNIVSIKTFGLGSILTFGMYGGLLYNGVDPMTAGVSSGLLGGVSLLPFRTLLKNHALKQKRLDLGFPAKVEMYTENYNLLESPDRLKDILSNAGLKKKLGRKKFVNDDGNIEVRYRDASRWAGRRSFGWPVRDFTETNVKVIAPKRKIAEPVLSLMESLIPIRKKISGGSGT